MTAVLNLTDDELSELREYCQQSDLSSAVAEAVRGYIRYRKRSRLIELADQVEMDDSWSELEQRELDQPNHG